MYQIGFGGSCHWCTEAIFQSLNGVNEVLQGWIASVDRDEDFSEAVIVKYDPEIISLETLIAVHLHSHSSTSSHEMRSKYRSAVYTINEDQAVKARHAIVELQVEFELPVITKVIPFKNFKLNKSEYLNYYYSNPKKPFCKNYITPKLKALRARFAKRLLKTEIN